VSFPVETTFKPTLPATQLVINSEKDGRIAQSSSLGSRRSRVDRFLQTSVNKLGR